MRIQTEFKNQLHWAADAALCLWEGHNCSGPKTALCWGQNVSLIPLKGPFPTVHVSFGVTKQLTHEVPVVGAEIRSTTSVSIWNILCLLLSPTITLGSWKRTTKTLSGKHTNQVNPFSFLVIPVRYLLLAFTAAAFSFSGTLCTQPALLLSLTPWIVAIPSYQNSRVLHYFTTSTGFISSPLSCLSFTVNSPEQGTCFLQVCTKACKFTAL